MRSLLPHEWVFGCFMALTWGRFAWKLGPFSPEALLYCALLILNGALIQRCEVSPSPLHWNLRLLFHPLAMNLLFSHMKGAIPKLMPLPMDGALQRIDSALVGSHFHQHLERLSAPFLTECLSFCYLLFFPYLLFSLVWYFRKDLKTRKAFLVGLFTVYGIGFLGYSLVPARGPWIAMPQAFHSPLEGGLITHLNDRIVRMGTNGVDVFPSLHCAVSSYILFFDRRHARWRFLIYLAPCLGLWFSTLYLRYHYLVDVLCGFALAAIASLVAYRFEQRETS